MKQGPETAKTHTKTTASSLILPYFRENTLLIVSGLVFLVIADALQLFIPRIVKHAVDDLTLFRAGEDWLLKYGLSITGVALLIAFVRYGWRRCLIGTSRLVEEGLRDKLFSHLQTLSARYFARTSTGDLMAHATNDIINIRMATGMGMVALTDAVFLGTCTIIFMVWINGLLTLFALIPMPLIVISARMFSKLMHARYKDVQATFSTLTEGVRESFSGIRIIKAYTLEKQSTAQVEKVSQTFVKKNIDLIRVTGSFFPLMVLFSDISLIIVIYLGGRKTIFGDISPGDLVAFLSYLGLLTWPMMALGWMTNLIQRGRASLDRISVILDQTPDIKDTGKQPQPGPAGIGFHGVDFSFAPERKILSDITLSLEPGKILGIVGPPGCGKSTLLQLIPRIYDVTQGAITLDGEDIRDIGLVHLRNRISFMPQEPFLFEGTIRDNILMGGVEASPGEIENAVNRSWLVKDLKQFHHGLDTLIGEKGVILSGGQKQRVALARALLHNRDIMIFDDPISQVDTQTGSGIIQTLTSLTDKYVLVSTHRLSAVRKAHEIIVLDQGVITERGAHDQLMTQDGYYARTVRLQDMEEDRHAR